MSVLSQLSAGTGVLPGLGPVAANGRTTQIIALLTGSSAVSSPCRNPAKPFKGPTGWRAIPEQATARCQNECDALKGSETLKTGTPAAVRPSGLPLCACPSTTAVTGYRFKGSSSRPQPRNGKISGGSFSTVA